jgi:hypothetical protein
VKQEPYAWEFCGALFHDKDEVFGWWEEMKRADEQITESPPLPLYTAPRELSDEEIIEVGNAVVNLIDSNEGWIEFARAILKKASKK